MSRSAALTALVAAVLLLVAGFFYFRTGANDGALTDAGAERTLSAEPLTAKDGSTADGADPSRVERADAPAPVEAATEPVFVVRGALRSESALVPADVELYLAEHAPRFFGGKPTPAEMFGALVEGLDVDAYSERSVEAPTPFVARVNSDAEGRFELGLAARPERVLFLWIVDDVWSAPEPPRLGVPLAEAAASEIEVAVVAGAKLSGRVVDAGGRALAGATLLLRDLPQMRIPSGMSPDTFPPPQRLVKSDAQGRFEMDSVTPYDRYLLHAVHGEGATRIVGEKQPIELSAGAREEVEVALSAGRELRGRVEDANAKPIAGAEVLAIPAQSSFSSMEANTDPAGGRARSAADGTFVMRGLLPQLHLVIAEAPGYEPSRAVQANLENEQTPEIAIAMSAGLELRGVVKDAEGKPAVGAEVVLLRTLSQSTFMASSGRPLVPRRMHTGGEGRFAFEGLEDGSFELIATAADGQSGTRLAGLRKKQIANEIVLALAPFGRLEGIVVDAAEKPVTRFQIELQRRVMMGFLPATVQKATFADEAGRFRLDGLAPGKYALLARVAGRTAHSIPEVSVAADSALLRIVLPAVTSVAGIVVTPRGEPISGAEVSIAGDIMAVIGRKMSLSAQETRTDAAGRFELGGLPVGDLALRAAHASFAPSESLALKLVPEVKLDGLRLQLGVGGSVEGTVYDAEGKPEPRSILMAKHGPLQLEEVQTETGADGTYRMDGLSPGGVVVIAMKMDGDMAAENLMAAMRMENVTVAAGQTLVVDFGEPTGSARGTRLFGTLTENGKPKKNTMILASCRNEKREEGASDTGRLRFGTTDRNGQFEFKNLPPGPCGLSVVHLQDSGQSVNEFDLVVLEQPEQRHDLSLDSGTLSGRVRTSAGDGLANVQVVVLAEGVAGNDGFRAFVLTGDDGRFRFEGLAEGNYRATAGGPSFFSAAQNRSARTRDGLSIVAGRELSDIDFELEVGAILVGRLTDEEGKGVEGASLEARPLDQDTGEQGFFQGISGPDGRFRVAGVEPGVATVRVTKRGYVSAEQKNVLFEAGKETGLDLRVEKGVRLRVRVVDGQGAALGNASGRVLDAEGKLLDSLIGFEDLMEFAQGGLATGLLELGSFAPGDYVVRVEVEGRETQQVAVQLRRNAEGLQEITVRVP